MLFLVRVPALTNTGEASLCVHARCVVHICTRIASLRSHGVTSFTTTLKGSPDVEAIRVFGAVAVVVITFIDICIFNIVG